MYLVLWAPESKKANCWGKQSKPEGLNSIKLSFTYQRVKRHCHPSMQNSYKFKELFLLSLADLFWLISLVLQMISA